MVKENSMFPLFDSSRTTLNPINSTKNYIYNQYSANRFKRLVETGTSEFFSLVVLS